LAVAVAGRVSVSFIKCIMCWTIDPRSFHGWGAQSEARTLCFTFESSVA
jgi:hypothetical protein